LKAAARPAPAPADQGVRAARIQAQELGGHPARRPAHLDDGPLAAEREAGAEAEHAAEELHGEHAPPAERPHALERALDLLHSAATRLEREAPHQEHGGGDHAGAERDGGERRGER